MDLRTRRFQRFPVDLPVTMTQFWEETPVARTNGRCHILAEGGLAATVGHDLYIGEVVRLEVPRLAQVYASVRSIHGHRYGFEFVYMEEGQRKAIRGYCAAQAAEAGGSN